jgi:hypothetical protein
MSKFVHFKLNSGQIKGGFSVYEENNVHMVLMPKRREIWAVPKSYILPPKERTTDAGTKPRGETKRGNKSTT